MIILSALQNFAGTVPGIGHFFSFQNAGRIIVTVLLAAFVIFSIWKTWRIAVDLDKSDDSEDD
jgi:hypothetical protein